MTLIGVLSDCNRWSPSPKPRESRLTLKRGREKHSDNTLWQTHSLLVPTIVTMGKRTGGLTGVSRFAREVFGSPPPALKNDSTKIVESPPILEEETPSAKQGRLPPDRISNRPTKRRKIRREKVPDSFDAGKYDATGLVPHYRTASQVPDHLKKCVCPVCASLIMIYHLH
jgi:hypothetical protein